MKTTTTLVALATLALGHLTLARSATDPQHRTEIVKFSDLDVTSERGAARLFQRLNNAATRVCRDFGDWYQPLMRSQRLQCENQAIGAAVGAIDAPAVTHVAREHGVEPRARPASP
jgi:UrcA family protein